MNIIAFAASNHQQSINKQLVSYAATLLPNANVEILDLNEYELPLFSQDREKELGQPELAKAFLAKISACDAMVISFAEHNGSYTAAYKNLFDWCSRIEPKVFQHKNMVMLSTSPGARGGASVLASAVQSAPFFHGNVTASLAIPSFYENFDTQLQQLSNESLNDDLKQAMLTLP